MHLEEIFPGIKASAEIVAEYIEAHAASTFVPGLEGSLYTTIAVVIGAWNLAHEDRDFKASLSVVFTVKPPGDTNSEEPSGQQFCFPGFNVAVEMTHADVWIFNLGVDHCAAEVFCLDPECKATRVGLTLYVPANLVTAAIKWKLAQTTTDKWEESSAH
jgi:hypothetical protein